MRVSGVVKFFSSDKGWGFILPDDGGGDVFVHQSDLVNVKGRRLVPDQRVSFEIVTTQKGNGRKAADIKAD